MTLRWKKDTDGEVKYQPPCPKFGHPKLDQRGFWSARSQVDLEQRFIIRPVYSNSPKKSWFHIVCYTLSDAMDHIYLESRTVKECKDHAQSLEDVK